ncbi:MAG: DUF885 family protein, partial [Aquabacterium sp.]
MHRRLFMASTAAAPLAAVPMAAAAAAAPAAANPAARAAQSLFDRYWQAQMEQYPEWATYVGDHRHGDRLRDASPAGIAAEFDSARRFRTEALALRTPALPAAERQSLDILLHQLDDHLALEPFEGFRLMSLGARSGLHSDMAELLQVCPVDNDEQTQQLFKRIGAYPRRMAQEIDGLRRARGLRWVPARPVLQRVLEQIDDMLRLPLAESPFMEPFKRLPADLPQARRQALRQQGEAAVRDQVLPQVLRLR